jgi:5-methylcytosine-specific restriction endonuclease McrA
MLKPTWYLKNRKRLLRYAKDYRNKHRRRIKEWKRAYYNEYKKEILLEQKIRYIKNKDTINRRTRAYYYKNKKKCLDRAKIWTSKNKLKMQQYKKRWSQDHWQQYYMEHREEMLSRNKLWVIAHRDKKRHLCKDRCHRIRANGGKFTLNEWTKIKKKYFFTCLKCHKREPQIRLTIDHIIPLSKGGKHERTNIQPLCQRCNSKKGTKVEQV